MKPARTRLIAMVCLAMQVAWGCCGSASGALLCWNAWLCACEGRPAETDCCGKPLKPAAPAMPSCCSGGDGACTCCVRVPTAPARTDHSNSSRTSIASAFDAAPAQPAPAFGWSPELHLPTGTFALSAAPDPVAARCAFAVTTTHLII